MVSEAKKLNFDGHIMFGDLEHNYQNWVHEFINELSEDRRVQVLNFFQELELDGCKETTVERYAGAIRTLGTDGKSYEDLTREDLIEWMHKLPRSRRSGVEHFSEGTVNLFKRMCRRFLRYCHTGNIHYSEEEEPEVLNCVRYKQPKQKLPKNILTKNEVRKIVEVCQSQRNRAMVFTLYESGCRAGEFVGMEIGDMEFDRHGATLLVDGKTGERRIRLVESVPDLQLWINIHPYKNDRNAPVWLSRNGEKKSICKVQLRDLIVQRAKWAGIEKDVYPHLFRHSRATHLANVLTEAQMREYFGWSENSKVPSRYVHLCGRDIDDALLEHYGRKKVAESEKDESLKPKSCSRCTFENPLGSRFCNRCGMSLDDESAMRIDEKLRKADRIQRTFNEWMLEHGKNLFREFMERSEVREEFAEFQG